MTQSYWCNRNSTILKIPTLHEEKIQTQGYEDWKWTTTTFFILRHVHHPTIKLHYYITTYYLFSWECHYVK